MLLRLFLILISVMLSCSEYSVEFDTSVSVQEDKGRGVYYAIGYIADADSTPAESAAVRFFPLDYYLDTSGGNFSVDIDTFYTDSAGIFYLDTLLQGEYRLIATSGRGVLHIDTFEVRMSRDTADIDTLLRDTLDMAWRFHGYVHSEPGDSAESSLVYIPGTDFYASPSGDNGFFRILGLPIDTFSVHVYGPDKEKYSMLDTVVMINGDHHIGWPVPLVPEYMGIPTPSQFSLAFDTLRERVEAEWNRIDTEDAKGYNIYRRKDSTGYIRLNKEVLNDTSFTDTSLEAGETYYYCVSVVTEQGEGQKGRERMVVLENNTGFMIEDFESGTVIYTALNSALSQYLTEAGVSDPLKRIHGWFSSVSDTSSVHISPFISEDIYESEIAMQDAFKQQRWGNVLKVSIIREESGVFAGTGFYLSGKEYYHSFNTMSGISFYAKGRGVIRAMIIGAEGIDEERGVMCGPGNTFSLSDEWEEYVLTPASITATEIQEHSLESQGYSSVKGRVGAFGIYSVSDTLELYIDDISVSGVEYADFESELADQCGLAE